MFQHFIMCHWLYRNRLGRCRIWALMRCSKRPWAVCWFYPHFFCIGSTWASIYMFISSGVIPCVFSYKSTRIALSSFSILLVVVIIQYLHRGTYCYAAVPFQLIDESGHLFCFQPVYVLEIKRKDTVSYYTIDFLHLDWLCPFCRAFVAPGMYNGSCTLHEGCINKKVR